MKTFKQMMEDTYSSDYKLDSAGRKHKARRIAFNYGDDDKEEKKKEKVEEKLDLKKADMGDVIKDFRASDAPQFKGKSDEKIRQMAIAAKLQAEELEDLEERNKENALKRKTMDASRGARYKVQNKLSGDAVRDWDGKHPTPQAQNKAIGRALRNESEETDLEENYLNKDGTGRSKEGYHDAGQFSKQQAQQHAQKHGGKVSADPSGKYLVKLPKPKTEETDLEEAYVNQAGTGRSKEGYHDAGMFDKATADKHAKTHNGTVHQDASGKHYVKLPKLKKEEVELDELNKSTLASYAKKATNNARMQQSVGKDFEKQADKSRKPGMKAAALALADKYKSKSRKREAGVGKAIDRLAKEEVAVYEAKDEREYGYEGAMAITQLKTMMRHAEHMMGMLEEDTDLPEWVQSKITLATDYVQTAHDYLMSEMNEGWDDMLKYAKEKNKPQPNGGAGKKQGTAYGGSKQKDEPVKEAAETPPFDGPYKKKSNKPERNSDGSLTSPMSKVKQLAKQAIKNVKKTVDKHNEGVEIDQDGNLLEANNKITFHQFMASTKKKQEKKGGSNAPEQV